MNTILREFFIGHVRSCSSLSMFSTTSHRLPFARAHAHDGSRRSRCSILVHGIRSTRTCHTLACQRPIEAGNSPNEYAVVRTRRRRKLTSCHYVVAGRNESVLILRNVSQLDSGRVDCSATNTLSTVNRQFLLHVKCKLPTFIRRADLHATCEFRQAGSHGSVSFVVLPTRRVGDDHMSCVFHPDHDDLRFLSAKTN